MQTEHLTDPQPCQSKQRDQQPRTLPATAIIATYSSKLPVRDSPSPERRSRFSGPATIGGKSSNHGIAPPAGSTTSYSSRLTDLGTAPRRTWWRWKLRTLLMMLLTRRE
jgi:hypothetical protein